MKLTLVGHLSSQILLQKQHHLESRSGHPVFSVKREYQKSYDCYCKNRNFIIRTSVMANNIISSLRPIFCGLCSMPESNRVRRKALLFLTLFLHFKIATSIIKGCLVLKRNSSLAYQFYPQHCDDRLIPLTLKESVICPLYYMGLDPRNHVRGVRITKAQISLRICAV